MRLAIALALENVSRGTGGPFGAAVFERASGVLLAVGVNRVLSLGSSLLHAEAVALMMGQQRIGSHTLRGDGGPDYELVSSCDPCAMCLGAVLGSGVSCVVSGADREDAEAAGFDEGPVFPESHRYLEARGIEIIRGVLRPDASAVLRHYREQGGLIYNR